jgi:hypothetical protein
MSTLRIDDCPGEDTRDAVRAVLHFMQQVFYATETVAEFSPASLIGCGHIMGICAEALKEREPEEGQATPDGG